MFKQVQNPRHVLSELLQNADDAGATEAEACLDNGEFVFRHNGEDFTEEHFTSLCNFGYSNKRTLHTIGFRGIGFKSTFSLGDEVRLTTPTLSVAFRRLRFTEPVWVERQDAPEAWTEVRVAVQDESRQQALRKNLNEWLTTPVSLLFFRSIRSLRIGERAVEWFPAGAGPVDGSEWMALSSHPDTRYLVVRSNEEDFPPESVAEIREERMVTQDEEQPLPPCRVELVLGVAGHLFVILPTRVKTALPFACNAPFVQDPARVAIKDPSTSPTNRWLLRRAGDLAAQAMLGWLRRDDLAPELRCQAYDLMPDVDRDDSSLEGSCAAAVESAFQDIVEGRPFLLSEDLTVERDQGCIAVPVTLLDVWDSRVVSMLLDDARRPALCRLISPANRRKLVRWQCVPDVDRTHVFNQLTSISPPKPGTWRRLLILWEYLAFYATGAYPPGLVRNLRIVRAFGKEELQPASKLVRLGPSRSSMTDEVWSLAGESLVVLDENWLRFLGDQKREADRQDDEALRKQVGGAHAVLHSLGLEAITDPSEVMRQVAERFFAEPKINMDGFVQLARLAAAWGTPVPPKFEFVTRDSVRRPVTHAIVADPGGRLEALVPKEWYAQHTLHDAYWSEFKGCTRQEWNDWVVSCHSGLRGFVPIEAVERCWYEATAVIRFCTERGSHYGYDSQYQNPTFIAEDWDFASTLWQHWQTRAAADSGFWGCLLEEFLRQPERRWQGTTEAFLSERAKNGKIAILHTSQPIRAAWIAKFRELPCLKDTHGAYRKPAELLRRTHKTEPLLDIEPFVAEEYDFEALHPVLDLLGVRAEPPGPDSLLTRLKALAKAPVPHLDELGKLYRRLDQMLDGPEAWWLTSVKREFSSERLIWSECGAWARASEVFLAADEGDVPGAPVILESVRGLALWTKVGVAERPTAELAIRWLKSLPSGNRLTEDEHRRVLLLLARYPEHVWTECRHWLNLEGEWIPVHDLEFSLTRHGAAEWKHLFPQVVKRTANLQKLTPEVCERPPFSHLRPLSGVIEERIRRSPSSLPEPQQKEWMQALGRTLRRVILDDAEETARVRSLAARLEGTCWQVASGLEVVPYISAVPVGTPRSVEVLWSAEVLYAPDRPAPQIAKSVVRELGRQFICRDVLDVLEYCADRSAADVVAYLEENLKLAPAEPRAVQPLETTNPGSTGAGSPPGTGGGGDGPGPVTSPPEGPVVPEDEGGDEQTVVIQDPSPGECPGDAPPADETVKVVVRPPSPPPEPPRPDLMARYVAARGYRPVAPGLLRHADGSSLARTQDGVFTWEHRSRAGDVLQYYWPKAICPEDGPLELDAVKWELLDKQPDLYTLILQDAAGAPMELTGLQVKEKLGLGLVEVHAAAYRIVFKPERRPE